MSAAVGGETGDRASQILRTAAELFARSGAKTATMRQIAAAVGVKAGSIYHHFPSKDDILVGILGTYLEDLNASYLREMQSGKESAELIRSLIEVSLRVSGRHPHAAEIYQAEQEYLRQQPEIFAEVIAAGRQSQVVWTDAIQQGYDDKTFRHDIPVDTFHRLLRDAMWMSVRWYRPSGDYTTASFANDIASVFLDGYRHKG